ncbi:hypothetical protein L218DRAFT_947869 [Marasmius fiardii PR-910]|nr:hypothetical protein L218DRAFT_947869 [Marasmius fiardii PR-910]
MREEGSDIIGLRMPDSIWVTALVDWRLSSTFHKKKFENLGRSIAAMTDRMARMNVNRPSKELPEDVLSDLADILTTFGVVEDGERQWNIREDARSYSTSHICKIQPLSYLELNHKLSGRIDPGRLLLLSNATSSYMTRSKLYGTGDGGLESPTVRGAREKPECSFGLARFFIVDSFSDSVARKIYYALRVLIVRWADSDYITALHLGAVGRTVLRFRSPDNLLISKIQLEFRWINMSMRIFVTLNIE